MKIYLVGGAIRDKKLGLPVKERDWVVVGATPDSMIALGFKPVGRDFPVFLHPETKEEYALARTERKVSPGYQGFVFNTSLDVTLEEDLLRRDLTINAMAEDLEGNLIDPYGGLNDLNNRCLRHISDAFVEDPVRILRVARFIARYHQFHFKIADKTMALMKHMVDNGEVAHLVPERVWQELYQALQEAHPSYFFYTLRRCGADRVIFPEIDALFGVPADPKHHPEIDTGVHTMMVLEAAVKLTDSPRIRFAALLHDLGKAKTPKENWPKHPEHENRGVSLVAQFCDRLRAPKDYKALALLTAEYHGVCHKIQESDSETIVCCLEALDAFRREARFYEFLTACEADFKGRKGFENMDYLQKHFLLAAYQVSKSIDINTLRAQGLEGIALGNAIHQARVAAIALWRK